MIVAGLQWLVGVLTDPATGVNAQLPDVPRDEGQDAPPAVAVFSELDPACDWVARGEIPQDVLKDEAGNPRSILIVRMRPEPDGVKLDHLPEFEQTDPNIIPFIIVHARRRLETEGSTETNASIKRDGRQAIRTCFRCISQQFDSSHTAIVINDCVITLPRRGLILGSEFAEPTDALELDSLVVTPRIVDRWALGLS